MTRVDTRRQVVLVEAWTRFDGCMRLAEASRGKSDAEASRGKADATFARPEGLRLPFALARQWKHVSYEEEDTCVI
jgi:hypothetical protein